MSDVEALARQRNHILAAFTATYAVWCGAFILHDSGLFSPSLGMAFAAISGIFGLAWCLSFLWLWRWGRRVRADSAALTALNDEMTVRNRWRAQRASAFTLLVCLMLGVAVTSFRDVSGRFAMEVLIWVLVVSQLGFYLWYDRSE